MPFLSGVEPLQVQETVENHLKSLLIKHFDPRKADSIFTEEGEVRNLLSSFNTSRWGLLLISCVHWGAACDGSTMELGTESGCGSDCVLGVASSCTQRGTQAPSSGKGRRLHGPLSRRLGRRLLESCGVFIQVLRKANARTGLGVQEVPEDSPGREGGWGPEGAGGADAGLTPKTRGKGGQLGSRS